MTRKTPERVTLDSLDNLPNESLAEHGNITKAIYIMFINDDDHVMSNTFRHCRNDQK